MKRIRVLVIEDSLTVRRLLVDALSAHADFEVVGEAVNGKEGIELCQSIRPDAVTLDMMMPVMNGLAATEFIMAYCPTPLLIVSSSVNRGDLFKTYEALAAGALDVLEKPAATESNSEWEKKLVSALRLISRIKVITHPRARLGRMGSALPGEAFFPKAHERGIRLVVMGASTGGPGAILEILKGLPSAYPLPILLVLHLNPIFGSAFADWLDATSPLRVAFAKDGEALPAPGDSRLILAPPDFHMLIREGRICLTQDPERHSCRPSVDVLFESAAMELGAAVAGCLLTGMGKDGASGLLAIQSAGGTTLAQDAETSVVFGMPREAILLGAAQKVLPLPQIAQALSALAKGTPA